MRNLLLLLAVTALRHLDIVSSEELTFHPNAETYLENERVTISCGSGQDGACEWFKSGRPVQFSSEKRYQPENGTEFPCHFTISPLRSDDDSRWKCQRSTADGQKVTLVKRLVVDDVAMTNGAHIVKIYPQNVEVKAGQPVSLECRFNSSAPSCFWMREGQVVGIKGRLSYTGDKYEGDCSISIDKASMADNGNWQCCYPKMDLWPMVKSSSISLNVLVTSSNPVITVNGIGMDEGEMVYVTKAQIRQQIHNYNYQNIDIADYKINCWSENGNPAASLWWLMAGPDGQLTHVTNAYSQLVFNNTAYPNIKTTTSLLSIRQLSTQGNILKSKLVCEAHHPNYPGSKSSTYVWLVWAVYGQIQSLSYG